MHAALHEAGFFSRPACQSGEAGPSNSIGAGVTQERTYVTVEWAVIYKLRRDDRALSEYSCALC